MDLFSPFISLGEAIGKKIADNFTTAQGVQTPQARPVSTQSNSFDLGAIFNKLVAPSTPSKTTTSQGGGSILTSLESLGNTAFNAIGRNLNDSIDSLFGNGVKKNNTASVQATNVVSATDPGVNGSQFVSLPLSDIFKLFNGNGGNPAVTANQATAIGNNTSLYIAAGIGLVGILLLTRKG